MHICMNVLSMGVLPEIKAYLLTYLLTYTCIHGKLLIPHADQRGGISSPRIQINNYPASIITKVYSR